MGWDVCVEYTLLGVEYDQFEIMCVIAVFFTNSNLASWLGVVVVILWLGTRITKRVCLNCKQPPMGIFSSMKLAKRISSNYAIPWCCVRGGYFEVMPSFIERVSRILVIIEARRRDAATP